MELGTVYATLGSSVVIVEALPQILAGADPDLVRPVLRRAEKIFKEIRTGVKVGKMATAGKQIKVSMEIDGKKEENCTTACSWRWAACPTARTSGSRTRRWRSTRRGSSRSTTGSKPATRSSSHRRRRGGVLLAHKASKEARIAVEVITGEMSVVGRHHHPRGGLHRSGDCVVRADGSGGEGEGE